MQSLCLRLVSASLILFCASCTTSLQELRQAMPTGNPFQDALSKEYLAFAESETRQYDWGSASHFADKGLKAAYGKATPAEEAKNWDIEEPYLNDLDKARELLGSELTEAHIKDKPKIAARAQFLYDCWVEQQAEGWQEEDITSCREGFFKTLKKLKDEPKLAPAPEPKKEEPKPLIKEEKPLIFSSSYIVFFAFDKYDLTKEAIGVVDDAVKDLKDSGEEKYEVVINGHADRAGPLEYNLKLSQKRAEAVKAALVERKIPEKNIRYYAFGETDSRVPTKDNVPAKANRRVEIFFNQ